MSRMPRFLLLLALFATLPFVYGAMLSVGLPAQPALRDILPHWNDGPALMADYGRVFLIFLSGVFTGFAARAGHRAMPVLLILGILPALWVFWVGPGLYTLFWAYVALLVLDVFFWWMGVASPWWIRLRLILTVVICGSFATGIWL